MLINFAVKLLLLFEIFPGTEEEYTIDCNTLLDSFWEEHNMFIIKTCNFDDMVHIWRSKDINNNKSHTWHVNILVPFKNILDALQI